MENLINHDLSETVCPECGAKNPARNSSDEIQCENCGYSENDEESNEPLICTHKNCKELQTADGEFCDKHFN